MPRSKRQREVALSKTTKSGVGRAAKEQLVERVRRCVDDFRNVYVLEFENMRNVLLQQLRQRYHSSKLFFGRNKVCAVALGTQPESEYANGLSALTRFMHGNTCLLFTNEHHKEVYDFFSNYAETTFARSGFTATETVELPKGALEEFTAAQEPRLRKLGLPTKLERGRVMLLTDWTVCSEGERLTPEKAKILEHLGIEMAAFRMRPLVHWSREGGATPL